MNPRCNRISEGNCPPSTVNWQWTKNASRQENPKAMFANDLEVHPMIEPSTDIEGLLTNQIYPPPTAVHNRLHKFGPTVVD